MSEQPGSNFITDIVDGDLASGKHATVVTRFPPEPNGYLHIGHAKSIALNFGLAQRYGGRCHLRFDDTNPSTEDMQFVESIQRDVRWLGYDWGEHLYFASDYYQQLYQHARHLIETGHAYVCDLDEERLRAYRGTVTKPGRPSPYRDRSPEENLALFERMRAGELPDGACVLRAKIDMASPNMKMRDPPIYRIKHQAHYRTGKAWCIYPLYDFTHCLSDAIEGITHSICTLEFENNRELYDWVLDHTEVDCHPQQIELARLELSYTMMSKRKLAQLVHEGHVDGWDDPRMPTLAGMRRRGVPPEALRAFAEMVGVAKNNSLVDIGKLEFCIRDELNRTAARAMAVLHPLEVVIDTLPENHHEQIEAPCYPPDSGRSATRTPPLTRRLYIERDDFAAAPPPRFHRLAPGRRVRLRHSYVIRCQRVETGPDGEPVRIHCSHEPLEAGRSTPGGKVKGTLHWVSAEHAVDAEIRLYDRLFSSERPGEFDALNPRSVERLSGCKLEPSLAAAGGGDHYQFERLGYFCADSASRGPDELVFNRTISLRDSWAKLKARAADGTGAAAKPARRKARRDRPTGPRGGDRASPPTAALDAEATERFVELRDADGLDAQAARLLARDAALDALYRSACAVAENRPLVAKWLTNELLGAAADREIGALDVQGDEIGRLLAMLARGEVSGTVAKHALALMVRHGNTAREAVESRGGGTLDDDQELAALVDRVLAEHAEPVARYRAGKSGLLGFFVGQVMRRSQGRADAATVRSLLLERLGVPGG